MPCRSSHCFHAHKEFTRVNCLRKCQILSLDGILQAVVSQRYTLPLTDRFVFERVLIKTNITLTTCKRKRSSPSADEHALANEKIPNESPVSSKLELQKLRGELASANKLLKTKEAKENDLRRRVPYSMPVPESRTCVSCRDLSLFSRRRSISARCIRRCRS